jgi:hypothetical protein
MPPKEKQIRLQPSPHYDQLYETVPMLRISGKWLRACGFKAGEHVNIIIREELLIVQPIKK